MKRRKEHVGSILILTALYLLTAVEAFSTTVPDLQPRIPSLRRPFSSLHMAVEHRKRRLAKNAKKVASIPKKAAKIYTDYAQRLWQETNSDARSLIAKDRASAAIKSVEHMVTAKMFPCEK